MLPIHASKEHGGGSLILLYEYTTTFRGGSRICGKGGGGSGYRECRRREGFWRVPFEDPLWNFKRGPRAPCAPPPPLNPLVTFPGRWNVFLPSTKILCREILCYCMTHQWLVVVACVYPLADLWYINDSSDQGKS